MWVISLNQEKDSMNQENHEIKSLGPQVFLETGSDKMEDSGRAVYKFAAITKDKRRNNITFHETGFARYYTENEFQVEVGITGKSNENNYRTIVHKGHYCVNADKGEIKLKAKNIVIEATNNLTLEAGNTIQIGYPQAGATKLIRLEANKIVAKTKGGNVGDILKTSSLFASFAGSFVAGGPLGSAAAGMLAKKFL